MSVRWGVCLTGFEARLMIDLTRFQTASMTYDKKGQ